MSSGSESEKSSATTTVQEEELEKLGDTQTAAAEPPVEYKYPLPIDITIKNFESLSKEKKEAIELVLEPKKTRKSEEKESDDNNNNDEKTEETEQKKESNSTSTIIPLAHLENVSNITIEVKKGPKIEHLNTTCLAVLVGNVEYLKKIIANPRMKKHCFVDALEESAPSNGRTIAEFACRCTNETTQKELFELLHENKLFDIATASSSSENVKNDDEKTSTEEKKSSPPLCKTLLDKPNKNGTFPIFILAQEGNLVGLKYAHEVCGMSLTSKHEDDGLNAFFVAVRFEKIEIVKYFIEKAKTDSAVRDLMESSVAVRSSGGVLLGYEGVFACACSIGSGNIDLLRLLVAEGLHKSALNEALENARPLKILTVDKAVADKVSRKDRTKVFRKYKYFPPLPDSFVSSSKYSENSNSNSNNNDEIKNLGAPIRHYQLSVGGDRSECNAPLHAAILAKDLAVVKYLCEEVGFDVDKDALVGLRTPLQIAARNRLNSIAEYLIVNLRCDVNKKSKDGSFPLYATTFQENNELVELLLKSGANTSFTWHGATPFFAAVSQSHVSTARLLLEYRADIVTQFEGRGPSQYARERGLKEMIAFLEESRIY